ncbi:MAG TPA: response regulator transcription factor [Terriglobales bacterium]|nr:response regulator transcription factor [Terriglobales bacterium]
MVRDFNAELRSEPPVCFVCSNHPLAISLINNAVSSDPELQGRVKPYSVDCKPSNKGPLEVLILDTCSVLNWVDYFLEWKSDGGTVIGLISSDTQNGNTAINMLHLGAAGILSFAENLPEQLLRAIHAVSKGRAWIRCEVIDAYRHWTRFTIQNLFATHQQLTTREKEILGFLHRDMSNRMIAQQLSISERTAKFHVGNIFRKLNLTSRRELQSLQGMNASYFCPDSKLSLVSKPVSSSMRKNSLETA